MKISEMTPEQIEAKRKYDREAKQRSRAKQKAARPIPTYDEATAGFAADFPQRAQELDEFVKDFVARVETELGRKLDSNQEYPHVWDGDEGYTVDRVARIVHGLRKGWIQKLRDGDEIVSGAYFADVSGSVVESVNHHGLKQSPTFAARYQEFLEMLNRRYGRQPTPDAAVVRAELSGTYTLPPQPEPKPEPPPEPPKIPEAPSVPSDPETPERGRIQSLDELQQQFRVRDPNIAPEAQRFLDGTV
jgi:hypothetical protein